MLEDGSIRGEGQARLFMEVGWANYWSRGYKCCLQINSFKKRSSTYFSSLSSQFDDTRVEVLGDVGQVLVQLSQWEGQGRWGKGPS